MIYGSCAFKNQQVIILVTEALLLLDTFQMSCTRWQGMGHSLVSTVKASSFQKAWIRYLYVFESFSTYSKIFHHVPSPPP